VIHRGRRHAALQTAFPRRRGAGIRTPRRGPRATVDQRQLASAARPCRAGAPSAEPGGGRASGGAQRRRLDPRTAQFGNTAKYGKRGVTFAPTPAGYNIDMRQYAQLTVAHDSRLVTDGGEWTMTWYGPDSTTESKTRSYGDVLVALNRAGNEGWELIDAAALDAEGTGHSSSRRDWSLTRYTFRRSLRNQAKPFSQTMGTGQSAPTRSGIAAGPESTESVTLVRFAVYCEQDDDSEGSDPHDSDSGLGTGRFFVVREVAHLHNQADIDMIESLGHRYEAPGLSEDLRERIKAAVADYAANWAEGQWGTTWWQTPQSLPLSQAADLFDGSADWLRGLIEHPVADALSVAGVEGPAVPVGAEITARFVTAQATAPLDVAALICEISGIVIGALTGAHVLVIACAKRFAHDEAQRLLGKGFEQVIKSIEQSLHVKPGGEIERSESSRWTGPIDGRQPSPSHDTEGNTGPVARSRTRIRGRNPYQGILAPANPEQSETPVSRTSLGSRRRARPQDQEELSEPLSLVSGGTDAETEGMTEIGDTPSNRRGTPGTSLSELVEKYRDPKRGDPKPPPVNHIRGLGPTQ
jgi:hypothetical protein